MLEEDCICGFCGGSVEKQMKTCPHCKAEFKKGKIKCFSCNIIQFETRYYPLSAAICQKCKKFFSLEGDYFPSFLFLQTIHPNFTVAL
jgi:hypothetical protein